MKTLQQEAEEYGYIYPSIANAAFIAGANSNYFKRQIIEAKIEVLQHNFDCLEMGIIRATSPTETEVYKTKETLLIQGDLMKQIQDLKIELKELE